MQLSDYQRLLCLSALDHLNEYSISKMFAVPVDPVKDNVLDYFEKIEKPMDLGTVRQKLIQNKYKTMDDFREDVNLIWSNAAAYNTKKSIIYMIAEQLDKIFQKDIKCIVGNDVDTWIAKNEEIKEELNQAKVNIEAAQANKGRKNARSSRYASQKESSTEDEEPELTNEEICALTDNVAYINDKGTAENVNLMLEYIKENEPDAVKDGEVDAEITQFSNSTLAGLMKIVDKILKEMRH